MLCFGKGSIPQASGGFKDTWWLVANRFIGTGERSKLNLSAHIAPAVTPRGNAVLPNLTETRLTDAGKNVTSLGVCAAETF